MQSLWFPWVLSGRSCGRLPAVRRGKANQCAKSNVNNGQEGVPRGCHLTLGPHSRGGNMLPFLFLFSSFQLALHRQRAINGNVSHYSTWLRDLNAMAPLPFCGATASASDSSYSSSCSTLSSSSSSLFQPYHSLLSACPPRHKARRAPHYVMNGRAARLIM